MGTAITPWGEKFIARFKLTVKAKSLTAVWHQDDENQIIVSSSCWQSVCQGGYDMTSGDQWKRESPLMK